MRYLFGFLCVFALSLMLSVGCGEGGAGGAGGGGGQTGGPVDGVLDGDPSAPAGSMVSDYYGGDVTADSEISLDANGARVDRTHVEIAFIEAATVGELNALLSSINARIVSMLEGVNIILVRIPDPGDLDALDELILQLEAEPIVRYVTRSYMPEPAALPTNYSFASTDEDKQKIDHHLAIRAHAAWNAKNALKDSFADPPLMIVPDYFGGGGLNGDFDVNSDPTDFEGGNPDSQGHGYHVLGIISATHGGGPLKRGLATGIYPGTLDLKVVDFQGGLNVEMVNNLTLMEIKKSNRNVVVNTSFLYGPKHCSELLVSCIEYHAISWIEKVRGALLYATGKTGPTSLENSFLHFSAAGNIVNPGDASDATTASGYNAARLLTGLQTEIGVSLDNLNNTLVIENRTHGTTEPYAAGCLNITPGKASRYPGDLSAIGTDVWSLTGNQSGTASLTGTSLATPQAAGLAAYVWALAPGFSPQELLSLLRETANHELLCASPVIDAYSAVLAVDKASVLEDTSLDDAPVRLAILDIVADDEGTLGSNGAFDEKDLQRFVQELHTFDPPRIDYSRFDLNGDGYTGGKERRTRFNLDIDYPPTYGRLTQDMDGANASFDENAVSDMEVLCYYAYSPFYTGDKDLRGPLLALHGNECPVSRIAYLGDGGSYPLTPILYTMNADGSGVRRTSSVADTVAEFTWSPDGKKIAFSAGFRLYIVDADGSNQVNLSDLTGLPDGQSDLSPSWAPDSKRIAFASSRVDWWNIYAANMDGSGLRNLTKSDGQGGFSCPTIHQYPMWSPVDETIAYRRESRTWDNDRQLCGDPISVRIYTINSDGTELSGLTSDSDNYPYSFIGHWQTDWSPDGKSILYYRSVTEYQVTSDGTRTPTHWYTNLCINTGGTGSCLTANVERGTAAVGGRWSPDGSQIAYTYWWWPDPDRRFADVRVFDLASGSSRVVADSNRIGRLWVAQGGAPSWSTDSSQLIVSGTNANGPTSYGNNIFMLNADGTGTIEEITANTSPRNENAPAWQP